MTFNSEIASAPRESRVSISAMSAELLRKLFLHHDGIVVGATVSALHKGGALQHLFDARKLCMAELIGELSRDGRSVNAGYLHVALRCLALQGWVKRSGDPASARMEFEVTPLGLIASQVFDRYVRAAGFIFSGVPLDHYLFHAGPGDSEGLETFYQLIDECKNHWALPDTGLNRLETELFEMIGHHLDGLLLGPLMIAAKMHGLLEGDQVPLNKLIGSRIPLEKGLELLEYFGWVERQGSRRVFTELGKLAGDFSLHYGLTCSYTPMFCELPRLIFNHAKNVTHVHPGKEESHVDRIINVLASGVAHRRYFEDSEKIIIELFNRLPLEDQPKFVADMGCGDGEWLKRIYRVVQTSTVRGANLERFPLLMVGADYNLKAREVVQQKLAEAGVPNIVLFGDVGDPEQFAAALAERGIDIVDGLHVRAFIDHNRPYRKPEDQTTRFTPLSTGAYADEDGNPIENRDLEQSLCEHLRKWVPYIHKHGLIILEAHNIEPEIASTMLGKTHATAFDTYHGYSNQYPVDFEAFIRQAERAGLRSVIYRQMLYPSRLPFVAISLNHFTSIRDFELGPDSFQGDAPRNAGEWKPDGREDLEDGNALHGLLYYHRDTSLPRRWCAYPTGLLVAEVLSAVEKRCAQICNEPSLRKAVTLVDYGVGTGFGTLELIKGLEETGLLRQFKTSGIDFRLAVCDFPSGWFAKAYELLNAFPFVSFYSMKNQADGRVHLLSELFRPGGVDIIFASMVFHLIPPSVLPAVAESFARVLRAGGLLVWNTPDTPPTFAYSDLIHSANRKVRKRLEQLLDRESRLARLLSKPSESSAAEFEGLISRFETFTEHLDPHSREKARQRAEKQILPVPTDLTVIKQALERYFSGKTRVKLSFMSDEELLDLALLPANQRNAGEIEPRDLREQFLTALLKFDVLPEIHAGSAGTARGMNLHWTFGKYIRAE
ncbi:MAG: AprA-related methyltransferase [Gammaproteobacteria bacterium]